MLTLENKTSRTQTTKKTLHSTLLTLVAVTSFAFGCRVVEPPPPPACYTDEAYEMIPASASPGQAFVGQIELTEFRGACDLDWKDVVAVFSAKGSGVEICDTVTSMYNGVMIRVLVDETVEVGESIDLILELENGEFIELDDALKIIEDADLGSAERNPIDFCRSCNEF